MTRLTWVVLGVLALCYPSVGSSQTTNTPATEATPATDKAEAYHLFLLGRHLESAGDVDGAVAAYQEAAGDDPQSGEILGELASLYARRNDAELAVTTAEEALAREPDNLTAHRILGLIYAARAGSRGGQRDDIDQAIVHLEAARGTILPDLQVELTLGRLYLANGQPQLAIDLLEALLEDEVGFIDAALILADAYEQVGRVEDAATMLEGVIASGRPSSRALRRLGELYGELDRWDDAVSAYERAVARNPRSGRAQREYADALLRAGQVERGRDVLRQLTANRPDDGAALYRLSEVELELGNLDGAAEAAERLIAVEPNGVRGPYALAEVHSRRHDYRAVVATLEPAIQNAREGNLQGNQLASLLGRVGTAYEQLQDYESAVRVYTEATELLPTSLGFGARLAQAYLDLGRPTEAKEALERIEAYHPGNVTLAGLEARALGSEGDVEGGASMLREILDANPDDAAAYLTLAGYYSEFDRLVDAQGVLEQADSQFPDNPSVLFQLGAVMERQRRYDEAEQAFRRVIAGDPNHAPALNYLGYMLADRGERLEESVDLLERAIAIDPHNGAYLDSLGWAYFKLDRLDLAETPLREASEQMAWNSVVQDHLGDLLFELGRYEEAIQAWETALAGDGEDIVLSDIERKMDAARQRVR